MDAKTLLHQTGETYAKLKSFAVEITSITEDGDDEARNRREQRAKAFFVSPDKVRIERMGRQGQTLVTNGIDLHHYSHFQKSYTKHAVTGVEMIPGSFRPDFPFAGDDAFLFSRIAESVAAAESLREEVINDEDEAVTCHVLSVKYQLNREAGMLMSASPVIFWVDPHTHLLRKVKGEATFRVPARDETHTSRHIVSFKHAVVNQMIPLETFEFSPPIDAIAAYGGGIISGHAQFGRDKKNWVESSSSSDWAGDAYVERSNLRLRGVGLTFERRIVFSEDQKEIRVRERIPGPNGNVEHDFVIPADT
jgi:outer membrane lipoprotein-sorting protein